MYSSAVPLTPKFPEKTDAPHNRRKLIPSNAKSLGGLALLVRLGHAALLEAVLEPPWQGLDVPATSSTSCPTALSLSRPIVCKL